MKRPLSDLHSNSTADLGSVKRQKVYSTRVSIPWKEQASLGGEFKRAGKGSWPVRSILEEQDSDRGKRYLVDWQTHPKTGEEFRPTWEPHQNVGDYFVREWERLKHQEEGSPSIQREVEEPRKRHRRVLPNSSGDTRTDDEIYHSDGEESPPSLRSGSSGSDEEIAETQEDLQRVKTPFIEVPPGPLDKEEYHTLRSSQAASSYDYGLGSPQSYISPILITSSSHQTSFLQSQSTSNSISESHSQLYNALSLPSARFISSSASQPRGSATRPHLQESPLIAETQLTDISSGQDNSAFADVSQTQTQEGLFVATGDIQPKTRPVATVSPARASQITESGIATPASSIQVFATPKTILNSAGSGSRPTDTGSSKASRSELQLSRTLFQREARKMSPGMASTGMESMMPESNEHHVSSPLVNSITSAELLANGGIYDHPTNESPELFATTAPLTIQPSIEEESAADPTALLDSKRNSSQESLNNQQEVETIDGVTIPVRPVLGPHEYVVDLPAEGKVKSVYEEIIKLKRSAITRFISRKGAPGTSDISKRKTIERNDMQELLLRLNDTVTHIDLGLPMPQTQFSLNAEQNAAYAEYAGSKFVLLGYLVDRLRSQVKSIAIFAQSGALQELIVEYLKMKKVTVHRHGQGHTSALSEEGDEFYVDLLTTQSGSCPNFAHGPSFILAFDVSFSASDPQVQLLRQQYGEDLPIIHLLVLNSSEHVERCVPVWLTSNIRLKVVVRTTYLASPYLGGDITYIPEDSDEPGDGSAMGMADIQRAVRKSPERKMGLIADVIAGVASQGNFAEAWPMNNVPELKLAEFESPPKMSRAASRTPQPRNARGYTPASRATTPVGRKRLLDAEVDNGSKRLRLTPVRELTPARYNSLSDELNEAHKQIAHLTAELNTKQHEISAANGKIDAANAKATEWQQSHADVLHRYERNKIERKRLVKVNKRLEETTTARAKRQDTEYNNLAQRLKDVRTELSDARSAFQALKDDGGDVALLAEAREEARVATGKVTSLEKSLASTKTDFEFTRTQYQEASRQATDLASEVRTLEEQVAYFKGLADDKKRSLKAMNFQTSVTKAMEMSDQSTLQVRSRGVLVEKLHEDIAAMKTTTRRGVQTRGSSVQPGTSPGPRSRQASPAPGQPGLLAVPAGARPPPGSRTQALRNER